MTHDCGFDEDTNCLPVSQTTQKTNGDRSGTKKNLYIETATKTCYVQANIHESKNEVKGMKFGGKRQVGRTRPEERNVVKDAERSPCGSYKIGRKKTRKVFESCNELTGVAPRP